MPFLYCVVLWITRALIFSFFMKLKGAYRVQSTSAHNTASKDNFFFFFSRRDKKREESPSLPTPPKLPKVTQGKRERTRNLLCLRLDIFSIEGTKDKKRVRERNPIHLLYSFARAPSSLLLD